MTSRVAPGPLSVGRFGELVVLITASLKTIYDGCDVRLARVTPGGLEQVMRAELPLFAPSIEVVDGDLWIVDPLRNGFRLRNAPL